MSKPPVLSNIFPEATAIPADYADALPCDSRQYLVGGELRAWGGPTQEIHSPILVRRGAELTPQRIGSCPVLDGDTGMAALDAACRAFDNGRGAWPTLSVAGRILAVEDFSRRMVARREQVVRLMSWEICKSLADCGKEFDRTVDYIRDTIAALKDLDRASSGFVMQEGILGQIRRSPLGVVLCMGPFNYPLNETFATLIPALIMGNTVLMKTPKIGKLLIFPLMECFRDAFPAGVINIVSGDRDMLAPIMASGRVNVLAFIGTSRAADAMRALHPKPHRLRCVLGLEAKNAAIVLADADMDQAVGECLRGSLAFNGQRCTAIKMIHVARERVEEFLAGFCAGVARLKVGMPWEPGVDITPLPEPGKVAYLRALVDDALAHGATLVNPGGGAVQDTIFTPAVLHHVDACMRVYHEEQFGPVVPVASFSSIEEPLEYVSESSYGQQVSLFGSDPDRMAALIDPLVNQVSRVNLNSQCQRGPDSFPFTGRKDSAEGTLSVHDALRAFSIRSLVAARNMENNKTMLTAILNGRKSTFLSTDYIF
ncbi:MAG: NADP-dependent glyceraldehyde-3-phosphate dehydrogenase [Proteobacteria bacterium]|nr:NADP-dependent glyceraldehyde-3-phosphate dehydrogenase [Pseudomonadota bacterium]